MYIHTYLSEGVDVERVRLHVVVLVDEVSVLLSLSLQCLLSSVDVGGKITLFISGCVCK